MLQPRYPIDFSRLKAHVMSTVSRNRAKRGGFRSSSASHFEIITNTRHLDAREESL